jgi:predicted MFS family arabinose efflux permease
MKPIRDYAGYVIVIAPLINSVSGIAIDLFAPSMPAIAAQMRVSDSLMQSSISITLVAYALGQLVFGLIADSRGRLSALLPGMALFVGASLLAMLSTDIHTFLLARALQGFAVGGSQVASRAMLVDTVKGERFMSAVVYMSLAWGLGPVVAPFIGGLIQQYASWRWNFALYAGYSGVLLLASLRLRESLAPARRRSMKASVAGYGIVLGHRGFQCAVLAMGSSQAMFLVWNVVGPFLVLSQLQRGPGFFGLTALTAGLAYLLGTLTNRWLMRTYSVSQRMVAGLVVSGIGIVLMALTPLSLNVPLIMAGILVVNYGQGLLYSNIVAKTLMLFPDRAATTSSLMGCLMMLCGAVGAMLTGYLTFDRNLTALLLFGSLMAVQVLGVIPLRRPVVDGV